MLRATDKFDKDARGTLLVARFIMIGRARRSARRDEHGTRWLDRVGAKYRRLQKGDFGIPDGSHRLAREGSHVAKATIIVSSALQISKRSTRPALWHDAGHADLLWLKTRC